MINPSPGLRDRGEVSHTTLFYLLVIQLTLRKVQLIKTVTPFCLNGICELSRAPSKEIPIGQWSGEYLGCVEDFLTNRIGIEGKYIVTLNK